jgi:hypothetical protein
VSPEPGLFRSFFQLSQIDLVMAPRGVVENNSDFLRALVHVRHL